jgi:hypothetical protein
MKKLLIGLTLLASVSTYANDPSSEESEYKYKESCSSIEYVINGMNKKLPAGRQLKMECSDTYDSTLWGAIKSNFNAKISITSSILLCEDAKESYRDIIYPKYDVHIGISTSLVDQVYLILKDHSIDVTFNPSGSIVGTMYSIGSIQFPYCE